MNGYSGEEEDGEIVEEEVVDQINYGDDVWFCPIKSHDTLIGRLKNLDLF
jgi:hypothetical protein